MYIYIWYIIFGENFFTQFDWDISMFFLIFLEIHVINFALGDNVIRESNK